MSAKIFLVPPKCEIIMMLTNHAFLQYCDSNIGFFSVAPCKVIALLCFIYGISSLLLLLIASQVIVLPTIAIARVVSLSRSFSLFANTFKSLIERQQSLLR